MSEKKLLTDAELLKRPIAEYLIEKESGGRHILCLVEVATRPAPGRWNVGAPIPTPDGKEWVFAKDRDRNDFGRIIAVLGPKT